MSTTGWLELEIHVPAAMADDSSAALISAGASGVQILGSNTLPPPDEHLSAVADFPEPPEPENGSIAHLIATFEENDDTHAASQDVLETLEDIGICLERSDLQWRKREDTDWSERWKDFFEPLEISPRLWVVPSWHENFVPPTDAVALAIDPGMAFGTGQHATTALCAEMIDRRLEREQEQNLLDIGTGSGILAIAAAKLGVPRVSGIDIDPEAIVTALENVERNTVSSRVQISDTPLESIEGQFSWVVANILAGPLIAMAPAILRHLATNGQLVLSGILSGLQATEVIRAFVHAAPSQGHEGLELVESLERGEWVALRLTA